MEKFNTIDEYRTLFDKINIGKHALTNGILTNDKFEKLSKENRLFYENVENGMLIYIDYGTYYNTLYNISQNGSIEITKKDKPVVIKSMYLNNRKERQKTINTILQNGGFELKDTMEQIVGKPEMILDKIRKPCALSKRIMNKEGFVLKILEESRLDELKYMQGNIAQIPFYQFEYFSDDDYVQEIHNGHVVCIINKKNNEICGVRHFFLENNSIYGWVAVKDEYKKVYGMALAFSEYSLEFALKKGHAVMGWITNTNVDSIRYHMKLGYTWTGRCMDEWIFE